MTFTEMLSYRLSCQCLTNTKFSDPAAIVAELCAVQAQDYAAAKWALGLRIKDAADEIIEDAFNKGAILRTHLMRPTWHFIAPEDIRWMLELTAPRVNAFNAYIYRKMELDESIFRRCNKLISKALKDARYITRTDLATILNEAGIVTDEERMACILMHAELDGLICSGPRIGKQFSYALLEERVPAMKPIIKDEALARLAEKYFTTRGPATLQDYVWWSGLATADARAGMAAIKSRLDSVVIGEQEYWYSPGMRVAKNKHMAALLLPNYDEYSVSYKERNFLYDVNKIKRALTSFALLGNLIVIDNQVSGTWRRTLRKDRVDVTLTYFHTIPKAKEQTIYEAVEQYGRFLGLSIKIIHTQ